MTRTMCNVKGVTFSDEFTENYHQLCCSPQLYRAFQPLFSSMFWLTSEKALINPPYTPFDAVSEHQKADGQS